MYYIEFFKKKDGVKVADFHETVRASFDYWEKHNPPDKLVLLLGRTWRMSPDPGYIAVWEITDFQRFREWEESARRKREAGAPNVAEVADMVDSGLYESFGLEHQ